MPVMKTMHDGGELVDCLRRVMERRKS